MINWILYRLGQFVALILPRQAGYRLAVFLCRIQFYLSSKDREAVIYNISRVLPESDPKTIRRVSRQVFENFGKYLIDFFRFSRLDKAFIDKYVKLKNIENLDKGLSQANGVIALSAHFGNWELGGGVVAKLGYPLWEVALAHAHPKVNQFFNKQRALCGAGVIPLGVALKKCYQLLTSKHIVAFLGDRDFGGKGIETDFCGRRTTVPRGPAKFCLKTKAAIVPCFFIREPDDSFTFVFEEPRFAYNERGELKKEIELIEDYMKVIEKYVKKYPSQWYMFQPFFRE